MTEQLQLVLIVAGLVVIGALAVVIYRLLVQERQLKSERQLALQRLEELARQQQDHLEESIRVISRAVLTDQCGLTEGCIRLKVLLEQRAPVLLQKPEYQVISTVYEATAHMPILDEWKKLKRSQKLKLTEEREALEATHRDSVLDAVRRLKDQPFE